MKAWEQIYHHSNKIWQDPAVTKVELSCWGRWCKSCFSYFWHDDGMDLDPQPNKKVHACTKLENIHMRIWIFEFQVHIPLLEVIKVHWPNDGCLTYWTWISSLEHVCFGLLPKLLHMVDSYKGQHPWTRRLASSLKTYWPSTRIKFTLEHHSPSYQTKT